MATNNHAPTGRNYALPPKVASGLNLTPASKMMAPAQDTLVSETTLASRWEISVKKLQADRLKGTGCRYLKIGRAVRYRLSDVAAFEAANLRTSTSEG